MGEERTLVQELTPEDSSYEGFMINYTSRYGSPRLTGSKSSVTYSNRYNVGTRRSKKVPFTTKRR